MPLTFRASASARISLRFCFALGFFGFAVPID